MTSVITCLRDSKERERQNTEREMTMSNWVKNARRPLTGTQVAVNGDKVSLVYVCKEECCDNHDNYVYEKLAESGGSSPKCRYCGCQLAFSHVEVEFKTIAFETCHKVNIPHCSSILKRIAMKSEFWQEEKTAMENC